MHDWYLENKHEIDLSISGNNRLLNLHQTYNKGNKHYDEQNKCGYIIELYCKRHSIDGVVCNKYHLDNNRYIKEYNDITIYDSSRVNAISLIDL